MKSIQEIFIEFLDDVENVEENFQNLIIKFEDMQIRDNKHELRLILRFISTVSEYHFRVPDFIDKIERTIELFKNYIKRYYSNSEIFNIFKNSKRILLFLIKNDIITVDESFVKKITTYEFSRKHYPEYFAPEIKRFSLENWYFKEMNEYLKKDLPEDFYEKRKKGENDISICKLIREDLVTDFIVYFNKENISPNSTIKQSIYETNSFLLEKHDVIEKDFTLIEYAAFFGSIQIFTFLKNENAELTQSLLLFAIHSKNAELIHLIEQLHVEPKIKKEKQEFYKQCFKEAIKCHHNDIAKYFINIYLNSKDENSEETFVQSLEYYNFSFLQKKYINEKSFCDLCLFDYYSLVEFLLTRRNIDVNKTIIQKSYFSIKLKKLYLSIQFKIMSFDEI